MANQQAAPIKKVNFTRKSWPLLVGVALAVMLHVTLMSVQEASALSLASNNAPSGAMKVVDYQQQYSNSNLDNLISDMLVDAAVKKSRNGYKNLKHTMRFGRSDPLMSSDISDLDQISVEELQRRFAFAP